MLLKINEKGIKILQKYLSTKNKCPFRWIGSYWNNDFDKI